MIGCRAGLPAKGSNEYAEALKSFYVGLAAMQVADDLRAQKELENAVRIASDEPAAWANLGILQMRQRDYSASFKSLEKARALDPRNGRIFANLAVLEIQRGDFESVQRNLKTAIEIDPRDTKSIVALAEEFEREGNDAEALSRYESILEIFPGNTAVLIEIVRLSAKRGDIEKLRRNFAAIKVDTDGWDEEIRNQHAALAESIGTGNTREVAQRIAFFRNVLLRLADFRKAIDDVKFSKTTIGEPFARPIKLPSPDFTPAPHDAALTFDSQAISEDKVRFAHAAFTDGDSVAITSYSDESGTRAGNVKLGAAASDVVTIDIDYDFRSDFVTAGQTGLRFFDPSGADLTSRTRIPPALINREYVRVFTHDVDIDGDLDLFAAPTVGPVVVLRNNADGSFSTIPGLPGLENIRSMEPIDVDEDGDMDLAVLSGSALRILINQRSGQYSPRDVALPHDATAIAIGDTNSDARLEIAALLSNNELIRVEFKDDSKFETSVILNSNVESPRTILIEDLDNNGASDFVIGSRVWLTGPDGTSHLAAGILNGQATSAADLNADGKLDLIGIGTDGRAAQFINRSAGTYGWQIIRPRSAKAEGDQRVNSFGIGGELELRSGLLAQKRPIRSPQVHFGLGSSTSTDLLRVIWGNGFVQAEFDLERDQQILVRQRLTGSCPHLFAWNGSEFKLVKDAAPLGTSLGLRVSSDQILPVTQTEEWYKIPGNALAAKDGAYELRITNELWETYYVDHYALKVIDHPIDTEVFANELYPIPEPLEIHRTRELEPIQRATDEKGNDVTAAISKLDEIYLDTFAEGRFQGIAEEHFVEIDLPERPADAPPLKLIADGWLHPTDTSLNVAVSQGRFEPARSLSLEIADASGRWTMVRKEFGVPAGKLKTVVIDIPSGARKARLRTNMEIFWDRLVLAESARSDQFAEQTIPFSSAQLAYRGFSVIDKASDSAPELPDYNRLSTTIERWRSIEGYYTRWGNIEELLDRTDDRYAIVASGDEIILSFPEIPPPPPGFKRDFILVGVGWIKEGDYNNLYSKTVLPLPTHATNDYTRRPTRLEDDPVYQKNRQDWVDFHTRYVAPDRFRNAVRSK